MPARPIGPINQKWGFGMAPLKPETLAHRIKVVKLVRDFIDSNESAASAQLLDALSLVKGLFKRTVLQDQWDWYTTWTMLGCPDEQTAREIAIRTGTLRKVAKDAACAEMSEARSALRDLNITEYLTHFLDGKTNQGDDGGFIYILSTRELPDILKIGQTKRTPETRTKEINSATGVIVPWAVRYAWRVANPERAEREIHELLERWRIRGDREAFRLDFFEARRIIRDYLRDPK
jgi:hypothetical protein